MSQTLDQFVTAWNGKYADYDGWYGAQCVDLTNYYQRDVIGGGFISAVGAKDWYEKYDTNGAAAKYIRVANNMADPNQLPARGDVVVWGGNLKGSGGYGHIGVLLSADKHGFNSFDQNFPSGSACHSQYHVWDNTVLGWLHPKDNPGPTPPPTPSPTQKDYVRFLGDYRTMYTVNGNGTVGAAKGRIAPNSVGGGHLDYEILGRIPNYVKIQTRDYGLCYAYVGPDVASLTQYYSA